MPRKNIFKKYYPTIIDCLVKGMNLGEVVDYINEAHNEELNENSLRTHVYNSKELRPVYEKYKNASRAIYENTNMQIVRAEAEKTAAENEFLRDLKNKYEQAQREEIPYSSYNAGYVTYLLAERAKMVMENPDADVQELLMCQKLWENAVTFLSRLEVEKETEAPDIRFDLKPDDINSEERLKKFALAIHEVNKNAKQKPTQTQHLLFE